MSAVAGTTPENLPVEKQSLNDAVRGWWVGVRNGVVRLAGLLA